MDIRTTLTKLIIVSIPFLMTEQALAANPTAKAKFACHGGKSIMAAFYSDSVKLKLSDGRNLTLPQAMSGSGARYANADESIVFWNKGDTAFITEGSATKETYSGCVVAK
jgi:membrane-bound inhibitor of C-type lysozyme